MAVIVLVAACPAGTGISGIACADVIAEFIAVHIPAAAVVALHIAVIEQSSAAVGR